MPASVGGPRVLLRQLREVMAEPESAQKRLDKIVVLIAANMVAEVCSIYLLRAGDRLELYATEGLNPTAVHRASLRVGQGLVGTIAAEAKPLNLADARSHPAFAYLPETGEEVYQSFMGVPILRSGHSLGVLVVQNRAARHYIEEEIEALQTTAMVLAEVVASGELPDVAAGLKNDVTHVRSHHIKGSALAEGIALGHVVLHEPRVVVTNLIAEDIRDEQARLDLGIGQLQASIDRMLSSADFARGGEHREVLDAYRMFARDRGWVAKMHEAIASGLTAEAAVERVQNDNRARMLRQRDAYLRERLHDFDDLANRLLRILTGRDETAASEELPEHAIVMARNMGPAELLDYDRSRLRGLALEEGGPNSHVAIVARALGIPLVGRAGGILDLVDPDDPVIVDGETGEIYIRPSTEVEQAYADKVRFRARRQAQYAMLRDTPPVTRDGQRVRLLVNAGLLVDLPHVEEAGADGIGLFRTELQFMIASTFPRVSKQAELYGAVLDAAGDRPVVFRSLDIGSDKVLPYMSHAKEENPALGWRAIRIALDRPALLKLQMRALLRAAGGRTLRVMFPMVTEIDEFRRARDLVSQEAAWLADRGGVPPRELHIGVMLEVPSLMWQIDQLMAAVDFVSVGSNDLQQFLFASDRGHPRLAGRYDALSPAMLKLLREVVEAAARHGVPLNLCGEMAGKPVEAMALIGIGFRSISMAPAAVGPVKSMILGLDVGLLEGELLPLLDLPQHSLRPNLLRFAQEHNISL
jgi:phosphotransferase system, enzyme I, PtsP